VVVAHSFLTLAIALPHWITQTILLRISMSLTGRRKYGGVQQEPCARLRLARGLFMWALGKLRWVVLQNELTCPPGALEALAPGLSAFLRYLVQSRRGIMNWWFPARTLHRWHQLWAVGIF